MYLLEVDRLYWVQLHPVEEEVRWCPNSRPRSMFEAQIVKPRLSTPCEASLYEAELPWCTGGRKRVYCPDLRTVVEMSSKSSIIEPLVVSISPSHASTWMNFWALDSVQLELSVCRRCRDDAL